MENEPDIKQIAWACPSDYTILDVVWQQKCCSCSKPIISGEDVLMFHRYQIIDDPLQAQLANQYHCAACAEQYFALEALGFISEPWENQQQLIVDYRVESLVAV